jgi:methionyl-tRNA formyltransferase
MLSQVAILAADTCRSRIYLQHLRSKGLVPSFALVLSQASDRHLLTNIDKEILRKDNKYSYNLETPVCEILENFGVPYETLSCDDPNSRSCQSAIKNLNQKWIVYSGPGGKILSKETLNLGKKFLHAHPGLLPAYKGSTTIYYSLLAEGFCGVSAFIMDEKIDNGPIIIQRKFLPPVDRRNIDFFYDSFIRAELLTEVISNIESQNLAITSQAKDVINRTYHIIHPILKSIAIYGKTN